MNRLKKIWTWIDDRSGYSDYALPLLKHTVPQNARWWYVFGSATLTCLVVSLLTDAPVGAGKEFDEVWGSVKQTEV